MREFGKNELIAGLNCTALQRFVAFDHITDEVTADIMGGTKLFKRTGEAKAVADWHMARLFQLVGRMTSSAPQKRETCAL